jgi:hypothetical protein
MGIKEIGHEDADRIQLANDRGQRRVLVNTVINQPPDFIMARNFVVN